MVSTQENFDKIANMYRDLIRGLRIYVFNKIKSMKKIFLSLLFIVFSLISNAQDLSKFVNFDKAKKVEDVIGTWTYQYIEEDLLKETPKRIAFCYITTDYIISFNKDLSDNILTFAIMSREGIFDYDTNNLVYGKCGFYDNNDNLVEIISGDLLNKSKNFIFETSKTDPSIISLHFLPLSSSKQKIQELFNKLFDYILNNKGYIRFIAPKYNSSDMDIKIPCLNN